MNRKTIIQILVIVICFGAAGLVLYNGFFKSSGGGSAEVAGQAGQQIEAFNPLPFGDDLAGELKRVLGRNGLQYESVRYPTLDESTVGIPVTDLIKPESQAQTTP